MQIMCWVNKVAKTLLCFLFCLAPAFYASAETTPVTKVSGQAQLQLADGASYQVKLMVDTDAVFYDKDKHKAGEGEYVSLFQIAPSNPAQPSGLCGSGSEVWLYVYQIQSAGLVEKTRSLVSSCLRSVSMESQNSGARQQDLDFSSVQWNPQGFSIQWFEHADAAGRPLQRSNFVLHDGTFLRQDVLIDESPGTGSFKREKQ
jgi:hypothetical protein